MAVTPPRANWRSSTATCCRPTSRAARRLLQLRVAQLARTHDVTFARSVATPESIREQRAGAAAGDHRAGRTLRATSAQFLYELETAKDFVIVDSIVLGEGDESSAPLNLTLNISTYLQGWARMSAERGAALLLGLVVIGVVAVLWQYMGGADADRAGARRPRAGRRRRRRRRRRSTSRSTTLSAAAPRPR